MRDTLVPRGPDQGGQALIGGTGLSARRLSIIDVAGSDQPIATPGGRTTVVYNGEVYNYPELRAELAGRGRSLTRTGDTETIPHLYEEFGIEGCLQRLRGMFAFALYDRDQRTLLLARDRLGIKPLYWGVFDGVLLFGSEIKACLKHPAFRRQVDPEALGQYLLSEFVSAPRSIYRGLHKLPPSHFLVLRDGEVTIRRYWHPPQVDPDPRSEEACLEELDALLASAVEEELVSEVPLGSLLSGGIDSSTITWYVSQVRERPRTFSIRFDQESFDESTHFRNVARRLETDHQEWTVAASRVDELFDDVLGFMDEPLADSSLLPVFALSRLVRESGTTVVLSGDGGDELLAGYPTYLAHQAAAAMQPLGSAFSGVARSVAGMMPTSFENVSRDYQIKRFLDGLSYSLPRRSAIWLGAFLPDEIRAVTGHDLHDDLLFDAHDRHAADMDGADTVTTAQYVDMRTYMVDSVLTKVDRASMACSIEVRPPLLDHRVAELAFRLPLSLRWQHLWGKIALRKLMHRRLPSQVLWRAKKGFGAPVAAWIRGAGRERMLETLGGGAAGRTGWLQQAEVDRLIAEHLQGVADHRRRLWATLVFVEWLNGPYGPGGGA